MPVAVTVLPFAAVLSLNVAVPLTVNESPAMRLSAYVTDAASLALYTLFDAVIVTASDFAVMSAVVVAVVFWL